MPCTDPVLTLLIVRSNGIIEHQLTVADRNAVTRIMIHFDGTFLIAKSILYRIADLFLGFIVDGLTPRRRRCVGVFVLHVLFYSIAAVTARGRAGDRGNVASAAAADLMANHATQNGTGNCSEHLMIITRLHLMGHGLLVARLSWGTNGFRQRSNFDYLRVFRLMVAQ